MTLAGVLQVYPLLNDRTSLFLFVSLVAVAAVVVVRLITVLTGWLRPGLLRGTGWSVGLAAGLLLIVVIGQPFLRIHSIPAQTGKEQVEHIQAEWSPGDVIVTDTTGEHALGYYWPELGGQWQATDRTYEGFEMSFPAKAGVFLTRNGPVTNAARIALGERHGETMWFLVSHRTGPTSEAYMAWAEAYAQTDLSTRTIPFDTETLYAVTVAD
jgi:hypothetical protein